MNGLARIKFYRKDGNVYVVSQLQGKRHPCWMILTWRGNNMQCHEVCEQWGENMSPCQGCDLITGVELYYNRMFRSEHE